jgi:hypothetical protein
MKWLEPTAGFERATYGALHDARRLIELSLTETSPLGTSDSAYSFRLSFQPDKTRPGELGGLDYRPIFA